MPATQSAPRVRTSASGKRAINLSLSNDVLEAAKHLAIARWAEQQALDASNPAPTLIGWAAEQLLPGVSSLSGDALRRFGDRRRVAAGANHSKAFQAGQAEQGGGSTRAGLHAGQPFHVSTLGMLLHQFVCRIQGRRKEGQTLLKIDHQKLPLIFFRLGKLTQDMDEMRSQIRHSGQQTQDRRARANLFIEDQQALKAPQFLGQRRRTRHGIKVSAPIRLGRRVTGRFNGGITLD